MVASQAFTLTPVKERPLWWRAFLAGLAKEGTVGAGARAANVSRRAPYYVVQDDPSAQAEWDDALEQFADSLEEIATKRGKAKSDVMLIVQLKAARPDRYRENQRIELTGKGGKPIAVREVVVRTRQEAKELLAQRNGHAG